MNNKIEIIYGKSDKYPKISINGERISRYMELSDLIYDDLFCWAKRMFESMDDELAEDYTLYLTGHPFHYEFLKALRSKSQYCTDIQFTPITYKISVKEKMHYADSLNRKNHLGIAEKGENVVFCSDEPGRFADAVTCGTGNTDYYITYQQVPENCGKYCVIVSDKVDFVKLRNVYCLYVTEQMIPVLADYFALYHVQLDYISAVFAAAAETALGMQDEMEFEAYTKEEYRVRTNVIPESLDCGESFRLEYTYYPACFEDPMVTMQSSDNNVVFCTGDTLTAQAAGSCTIQITDRFGTLHGEYTVRAEKHNYVSNISIVLPATIMNTDETLHFKCIVSPSDAEDADSLRYTVSDETVAVVSAPNELYALAPGRVKVTVSTPRVSRSVYINVLTSASDVILPGDYFSMPVNAEAQLSCSVVPMNARPMPDSSWKSSNPRVVRIDRVKGHTCVVSSLSVGTAVLTCSLDGTDICKTMRVDVEKNKGCYVATAVYGSYDCPQVWALRRYRDQYLSAHWFGRAFIKVYYALSPKAVALFGKTKWFNTLWKNVLDRKVEKLRRSGYADTPYQD